MNTGSRALYRENPALAASGFALDPQLDDVVHGWALCTAASAARILGDVPAAAAFVEQAFPVARRSNDDFLLGRTMLAQAAIHQVRAEWGNRCNTLRAGAAPFPGGRGGKLPGADVRRNWPYAAAAGDIESAAAQIDKGVALMRTTGDDWATAMALEIRGHRRAGG